MAAHPLLVKPENFQALLLMAHEDLPAAFDLLFDAHYPFLLSEARKLVPRNLRSKFDPDDSVQNSLLEAFRDFQQFHGTSADSLRAWLSAILQHNVQKGIRNFRRRLKRAVTREVSLDAPDTQKELEESLAAPISGPEEEAIRRESASAVQQALERLPVPYRCIIELRCHRGMKFGEVCSRLKLPSAEAARKEYARAMDWLTRELCAPNEPRPRRWRGSKHARESLPQESESQPVPPIPQADESPGHDGSGTLHEQGPGSGAGQSGPVGSDRTPERLNHRA